MLNVKWVVVLYILEEKYLLKSVYAIWLIKYYIVLKHIYWTLTNSSPQIRYIKKTKEKPKHLF